MLTDKRRKVYGVVGVIIHPIQNVKKLSCVLCQNTMRSPEVSSFLFGNVFVKFRPLDCLHWNPSLGRSLSFQIEVRPAMQSLQGNVLSIWALKSMLTRIILVTDSPGFRWKPTALLDPVSLKSPPPVWGANRRPSLLFASAGTYVCSFNLRNGKDLKKSKICEQFLCEADRLPNTKVIACLGVSFE